MRSIRIAFVGRFPLAPETFGGGVETSTANLLAGLRRFTDMELHVLTFTSGVDQPVHVDRNGIQFHYLPAPARLNTLTLHIRARRILKRFLRELAPDLVHALDALDSGYVCLKSARDYPLVVSIHGIVGEERKYLTGAKDRLRSRLTSWLIERYCVKKAPYLVEPTRYPEEYFGRLITGRIFDTGNAIADSFFEIVPTSEPEVVLYSGAVIARKRLLDLIEAVARVRETFPGVVLRVAGGAREAAYMARVEESIARHSLTQNVFLLGQLTPDQLRDEYRRCSFLVLPSVQETSPMVIGELMAAGRPVVATRVGGVPYLIDEGQTGFIVHPGDIEALVDRMVRLLEDSALRARMGSRAREEADRQFRTGVVARKMREVYLEAISATTTIER